MTLKLKPLHTMAWLIFSSSIHPSFAQSVLKIKGNVVANQQAVEFATVSLYTQADTTIILQQAFTDSLGLFFFSNLSSNSYLLKITLIGHLPTSLLTVVSNQNPSTFLPNINLNTISTVLSTVTITAQKKSIQKTTEGFIVNAAANITQIGGTATDLLKSTPTVAVDADGAITLRGKTPLILINGRNSAFNNIDQIPAANIETIEIINNASAKYDANAQSGIININLKKNKTNGTNAALSLGAGFGSKGRTANSLSFNHKNTKWNLGLAYNNRFAGRTKHITLNRTNFYLPNSYSIFQDRNDIRVEKLQNLNLNANFLPNPNHSFSFEAITSTEGQNNDETLNSTAYKLSKAFDTANSRHSIELLRAKLAEFSFAYNQKFLNPTKTLSINLSTSIENSRENTNINTQNLTQFLTHAGNPFLQITHNYQRSQVSNAMVDYALPLSKNNTLQAGYKATFRTTNNDYLAANLVANNYIVNAATTNIFYFHEQIHAAYAQLNAATGHADNPTFTYLIGLRAEQVTNHGNTQNNSTQLANQYLKLFPTASLTYLMPASQSIAFSYAKRINRPDLDQLNPFVDITDALNPHSGNPNLKPETIHAFEIAYNKQWSKYTLSTSLFYRNAHNTIRGFLIPQANGAVLRLPVNIGTANSFGVESIITARPSPVLDANLSFTLFQQKINAQNLSADARQNTFNYYAKFINNLSINSRSKLQIIANYNSALTTPQGSQIAIYNLDAGFQQKLGKGNARLGIIVVDLFNTLKSGSNAHTTDFSSFRTQKADTRAIIITFAHSFKTSFKEKLLENKFSKEF